MAAPTATGVCKTIGAYELMEQLGDGGMGTVYKARHQETGEAVALKIIHPQLVTDPVFCRRLEEEFRAARSLKHPHIVRGLDCDFTAAVPYFVMEYVDGESLGDRIRREGPLSAEEAVAVILPIAEAVQLVHQHNYIHRDIKPDNILLTSEGRPKLTDLGLVKCLDADVNLTQGCSFLGTANYAAPEQFDDPGKVDARADIYSLGATLYTAITGDIPFFIKRKQNHLAILKKKLLNELTPPRRLVPDLSEAVDFAIRRAMRADKSQRHASCEEFIAALTGTLQLDETGPNNRRETAAVKPSDRRAAVRHVASLVSQCVPLAKQGETAWKARVVDISTQGARLIVFRRFEPGTILTIDIDSGNDHSLSSHLLKVMWVRKENGKEWSLGGTFIHHLSSLEVKMLLSS